MTTSPTVWTLLVVGAQISAVALILAAWTFATLALERRQDRRRSHERWERLHVDHPRCRCRVPEDAAPIDQQPPHRGRSKP